MTRSAAAELPSLLVGHSHVNSANDYPEHTAEMPGLSVVTLTLNEELNIAECLSRVQWADQIIVVDSGSTDRTVEIAGTITPHVMQIAWQGYGHARNLALEKATGDWVLWLDADERVSEALGTEIRAIVEGTSGLHPDAFDVARRAYFLGRWIRHSGWYPGRVVRLFRRGSARFSLARVHEQLLFDGNTGHLQHDLDHFTDRSLDHYFQKFNRYTGLAAQDMHAAGRSAGVADLLLRPPYMFIKMYIFRLGFLDGLHGLILCVISSLYVFVKYAKLWELRRTSSGKGRDYGQQ